MATIIMFSVGYLSMMPGFEFIGLKLGVQYSCWICRQYRFLILALVWTEFDNSILVLLRKSL